MKNVKQCKLLQDPVWVNLGPECYSSKLQIRARAKKKVAQGTFLYQNVCFGLFYASYLCAAFLLVGQCMVASDWLLFSCLATVFYFTSSPGCPFYLLIHFPFECEEDMMAVQE